MADRGADRPRRGPRRAERYGLARVLALLRRARRPPRRDQDRTAGLVVAAGAVRRHDRRGRAPGRLVRPAVHLCGPAARRRPRRTGTRLGRRGAAAQAPHLTHRQHRAPRRGVRCTAVPTLVWRSIGRPICRN
ncbi:hypothetical protein SBRY_60355 [Actinacidiphila bryophytorum]|uniref:Uncharacterized protein n=1 Tax=Actinacidiphila bryophytorum TaxID=1436133 RepID=A0A9W4H5Q3_9ACTN|nr:hypothetical protein SBRY_60355 [Actinacidiphila bryophytorum]